MFSDRNEAGRLLAEKLTDIKQENCIVLAIPRGGIVVGDQVAKALGCALDVVISKKINPPGYPEYAIGAVMPDGTIYWNQDMTGYMQNQYLINEINEKKAEAERRLQEYRGNEKYDLNGKTAILVDDGIATGSTVLVILKWLEKQSPKKIIVASPVIPTNTYEQIKRICGKVTAILIPSAFYSVGDFYEKFKQVSDSEVRSILSKYRNLP